MSSRILLAICTIVFAGGGTSFAADVHDWDALQAQKKELSAMRPFHASGEEFDGFVLEFSARAAELADAFKAFHDAHPDTKNGREAWRQWMTHLDLAAQRIPERKTELEAAEKRLLADPNLSRNFRESIRWNQVDRIQDLAERERFVREVQDEFSGGSFISHHLLGIASFTDTVHARALVEEVLNLPRSEHERAYWEGQALAMRERLDRIGKPVHLKFTALDGRQIDLNDYAGKVVLLDFWATWCGPCIAGLPKLRNLWEQHRARGFEVICISYDTDRKALEKFVAKNSIPWPQYYSDQGYKSDLVASFGKPGPPAYWLVDGQGRLAEISAWNDLERKIRHLLAQEGTKAAK